MVKLWPRLDYVPAKHLSSRIAQHSCTRIRYHNKFINIFEGNERQAYLLHNAKDKSLMLNSEVGRGTNTEYLLRLKAFTQFAIDVLLLCHTDTLYPNIENMHF